MEFISVEMWWMMTSNSMMTIVTLLTPKQCGGSFD